MAVIDQVPGIEVTIQVDGENATEYVDPHAPDSDLDANHECPIITKYIESIDDTKFSVKVAIDDDAYAWDDIEHCLSSSIVIDGNYVGDGLIEMGQKEVIFKGNGIYSKQFQQWYRMEFKFSAISIVEDRNAARVKKDKETMKNIGLIEISLNRRVKEKQCKAISIGSLIDSNILEVAEKALKGKAVSHSASFCKVKAIQRPTAWRIHRVSVDNGPIATVRFMYRSRESLKQELIIPRSPSPSPAAPTMPRSVDNMTGAEIWRLAQERLDQINWAEEVKSHNKSAMKRQVNEVVDVDEEAEKARKAKRRAVNIDLTDD
ncbi:hypothetical protein E0Z10_g3169 [Xylaria hypoxylon]|uniref:DUF7918 domain-containing protein n=1 Tax=Xylaria hypoxylon TaxID=37992 RepID=A0A4Z0YNY6_9PEZI|nr:hypothetical protein E0Z10_g3169 [Xylaria hypoxylon]